MPKNIDDMIVPERKRSIRDIPIPEGRRKNVATPIPSMPRERQNSAASGDNFNVPPKQGRRSSRSRRKRVWLSTGVAALILIFGLLSLFNTSTLAYVPKSAVLSFANDIYTARKTGSGGLSYSVVKLSGDKGLDVAASGEEKVSRKSSGTIIVYNNASTEPQRLVENTRFQTPNGLVYRISSAITVPGRKTVSGVVQPGSVETIVYADQPGGGYNIGLTDFTLPGLVGTPRFTTVYARSKTDMSGGFVGTERVVSPQDKAQAKAKLEQVLRDELTSEVKAQVPEDFILISPLSSVSFEDLPQTESANKGNVKINMRGNLYGVMFKRSDLSNHLASKQVTIAPNQSVDLVGLDSLVFAFSGARPTSLLVADEISFSVAGEVKAVWRTDEIALKADLAGKHKRDVPSILNNYPTVASANVTIRPFWKSSFPDDSTEISVKKLLAQ